MITIENFVRPENHPYGMLSGYGNSSEKESILAFALDQCVTAGGWVAVSTKYSHPAMVEDGLLEKVDADSERNIYFLTEKAKGLLYTVYHK